MPTVWVVTLAGGWFRRNPFGFPDRADFPTTFRCVYKTGGCHPDTAVVQNIVSWNSEETIDDLQPILGGNQWWGVDCGRIVPDGSPSSFRSAVSLSLQVESTNPIICKFVLVTAGVGNTVLGADRLIASTLLENCLGTNTVPSTGFTPVRSNSNFSPEMGWYLNGAASWSPEA
jgi:hypothetical protein